MCLLVDQELSAKIESELQMEKDIRDSEQYPSRVQEYLDSSPFEVRYFSMYICAMLTALDS